MKTLHIDLGERSYDIHIASGLLDKVGEEIEKVCPKARRLAVVTDTNVDPLYSERVTKSMEAAAWSSCSTAMVTLVLMTVRTAGHTWSRPSRTRQQFTLGSR